MTIELRFQGPPQPVIQPIRKPVLRHPIGLHFRSNLNGENRRGSDIKRLERKGDRKGKRTRENNSTSLKVILSVSASDHDRDVILGPSDIQTKYTLTSHARTYTMTVISHLTTPRRLLSDLQPRGRA